MMTPSLPVPTPNKKNGNGRNAGSNTGHKGHLLKDQLEVVKVQLEGRTRYSIKPIEDQLTFDKGFYVFIRAIQTLTTHNSGVVVVGLAGPSGSGKTAFSEKVQDFMPGCAVLSLDNYNDASRLIDGNFDDPRLTDYDLLLKNIKNLKEGRDIQAPIYDFKTSSRVGYRTVPQPTSRVVIVEGIYALSAQIRPLLDLRVCVTGGVHLDLVKRVLRDIKRSGQAPEEIIQQITDTVYPMYKAFIEPDLATAHLKIYNTFNPFSGFMAPTYILKSAKQVSVEAIKSVLKADHTHKRDSDTYDIYLLPPGEDVETCTSWLRMRNRDGRYNLMFEEWVTDGPFVISPRITFEVSVRILGGLMALGYEIGTMLKRSSAVWSDEALTIKVDDIEGMEARYVQIQGKERTAVAEAGRKLGLDGTYIARSYIEQALILIKQRAHHADKVQLEKLTASFQCVTEDLRRRFMVDGEPLLHENSIGSSPVLSNSFRRISGFSVPERTLQLSTSAPLQMPQRHMSRANSNSSNGLLSHAMRNGAGSNDGNANGNGRDLSAVANGNGYSSRHSSEYSNDDEWDGSHAHAQQQREHREHRGGGGGESRPGSTAASSKLERMVVRLRDKVEELAQRPLLDVTELSSHILNLTTQQQALSGQVQALVRALERRDTDSSDAAAPSERPPAPASAAVAAPAYHGVPSAVGFAVAGALAAAAVLSLAGRSR